MMDLAMVLKKEETSIRCLQIGREVRKEKVKVSGKVRRKERKEKERKKGRVTEIIGVPYAGGVENQDIKYLTAGTCNK